MGNPHVLLFLPSHSLCCRVVEGLAAPSRTPEEDCNTVTESFFRMTAKEIALKAIGRVCADKGHPDLRLSANDALGEEGLGLDSLDMATIVAELDLALNKDPFANGTPRFRTVGDLIALYAADDER